MKKKLLSVLLSTAMVASLLVGCGDTEEPAEEPAAEETEEPAEEPAAEEETEEPAEEASAEWKADLSADTGAVLNIYCWNEEFKTRVTDHYPGYTDNGDGTGAIGDVKVNWVIVPSDDMAYQNNLDETLLKQADAADDDKIDMFLIEADYALKYVNAEGVCVSMDELGLTDYMADQYQYTKDVVTDGNGNVNGTSWQACPGLYIYRRSVAKEVFGTDDPAEVQTHFSDWDKFAESAQTLADAGWKVVSGYDDAYRVFSQNVS
ncbi:MAG: carbohydrate ABC transporter substrate-binding protein, partial [Lachnospiraceae bacterium]|nr:carbohydrate ABC transporter substrate-binding protein [Lachnospiraceae bacterium]